MTIASPEGTAFWLAPGTHVLPAQMFGQVIPKNGDTYIGGPGAVLDGRGVNRYAFTQHAVNVTIRYLTIQNFVAPAGEGVVNHDAGRAWVIEHNTVQSNGGAGVILGDDNVLAGNCLADNGQYGFQGFGKNMVIDRNEVARNDSFDYETKSPGCGCSGGAKFWNAGPASVTNNYVHDNLNVGLWADTNNVGLLFQGNYISGNRSHGIMYEASYNARIENNTFARNAITQGQEFQSRNDPFPVGAIYVSESGGDGRVNGGVYQTFEISANLFLDNWSGVVLWENADRFCGSPANSSTGYCTLGGAATLTTCIPGLITAPPFYSDCRWKTQNVSVKGNDFRVDRAAIGCTTDLCATQGVLSNYGTYPSWSPYQGRAIQDAIVFSQNNRFSANHYTGGWTFTAYETGRHLTWSQWTTAPYSQDPAGTYEGAVPTAAPTTTTPAPPSPPETIWPDESAPAERDNGLEYTLGTRFVVGAPGTVVALRFYQTPSMLAPVNLKLWRATGPSTGVQLATATLSITRGASGWRNVALPGPVHVDPSERYVVSYHTPVYFPFAWGSFTASARVSGHLTANLSGDPAGYGNGLYKEEYGTHTFPTRSDGHSYFADVVYRTD